MQTIVEQMANIIAVVAGASLVAGAGVGFLVGRWTRTQDSVFVALRNEIADLQREARQTASLMAQKDMAIEDLKDQRRAMRAYAAEQAVRMRRAADHFAELADLPGEQARARKRQAS